MEKNEPDILSQIDYPDFDPDQMGARFWYEQYLQQREENRQLRTQLSQLQGEVEQLKEALRKLTNRNSENSSKPPSADAHKKKNKDVKQRKKKQGPKYSQDSAKALWISLPGVYRQCAVIYTDGLESYQGVLPSKRHRVVGKESGKTSYIERLNNTLRQRISRLVRKTLFFSKNQDNHEGAIWNFIHHYNASLNLDITMA